VPAKATSSVSIEDEPSAGEEIAITGTAFTVWVTCAEPRPPWLSMTEAVI
jgi:hypothetical protein